MTLRHSSGSLDPEHERRLRKEAEERWREAYGPDVAEKLRWDERYSILRIGGSEFAFSDYDRYLAALRAAWAAGLIPDHGPSSVPGIDLPDVAPSLRGVDVEIVSSDSPGPEPES